jgi:hypothetical protein
LGNALYSSPNAHFAVVAVLLVLMQLRHCITNFLLNNKQQSQNKSQEQRGKTLISLPVPVVKFSFFAVSAVRLRQL